MLGKYTGNTVANLPTQFKELLVIVYIHGSVKFPLHIPYEALEDSYFDFSFGRGFAQGNVTFTNGSIRANKNDIHISYIYASSIYDATAVVSKLDTSTMEIYYR